MLILAPVASPGADGSASGWQDATPEAVGIDRQRLEQGIESVSELSGVRTLLVVRHGRLVVEESFAGSGLNRRPWNVKSASKSILSALVGIAIDRGWLRLDSRLGDALGSYAAGLEESKRAIELADLLTMRSGLATTSFEHYGAWVSGDDWTAGALARPLEDEPGTEFRYSTGDTHLVSTLLTEAAGRSTLDLLRDTLAVPLGIEIQSWQRSPEGYYFGGNNLEISPLDLARFGLLYLQEGSWQDRQLVPADWVRTSTEKHAEGWPDRYGEYGYFWWLPPNDPWDSFAAIGYGTQVLYVVPELDMLVVVTATLEGKGKAWDRRLFEILREEVFGAAS